MGVTADINLKNDLITKVKFVNIVRASYPQDMEMKKLFDKVIDKIFNNGLDSTLSIDTIYVNIKKQPESLELM